ncbi:cold-shock protein [Desulfoferrobacter suflitae]|uniref:cold-shock protein n=1 Tax=Desulfoferrobacter suflitae TaxID=2865782 RepID=UPI0021647BBC|nr:cold shock domain-containing protein [Desulfoferrobacter suflitae]MCK8600073.1 cold shock domain-containing protein [Desulfoferrobacter suflitae]
MKRGKVTSFDPSKGYGFILGGDGKQYFAHCSKIVGRLEERLYVNEYVQFQVVESDHSKHKYDAAINIQPILDMDDSEPYQVHRNPFIPRSPINNPEKFAGRKTGIKDGVTSLVNNSNILITGDRGIGKSSFANQLVRISEGDTFLLKKMSINLPESYSPQYAAISIRGFKDMTLEDVAGGIVRELVVKFDIGEKLETEHQIDLKVYKFKAKSTTKDFDLKNIMDFFGYDIIKICDTLGYRDGLLILIDEVENIDPTSGFANFIKNITEYFSSENRHITFVLSGIPCTLTDLFLQHPSFLRLFSPIELKEFSAIESYELLDSYLGSGKKRYHSRTRTSICKMARGYPVNLQLLGFYAYQIDKDSYIDDDDLKIAVDYILDNVKKEEFISKHESIGFGLAEQILKLILRERQGANISFQTLLQLLPDTDENAIITALDTLEKNELIYKYSKGNYFIKDYLFHKYLQKYYERMS